MRETRVGQRAAERCESEDTSKKAESSSFMTVELTGGHRSDLLRILRRARPVRGTDLGYATVVCRQ